MSRSKFIYGSLILAAVNFIVRLIGFSYRIILSKLIGAEGIGLFQMVFPVLMVFITITTAGIPIAVSKLVAKQTSTNNYYGARKIFRISLLLTMVVSFILSGILLLTAKYISYEILENHDILYSIYFIAPAIMIISLSSVIRGYYYGMKKIGVAGIAQILEQVTRIAFVLGLIYYLRPINSQLGAFIAVIGISVGEVFGLLWLLFNYRFLDKAKGQLSNKKLTTASILSQISYITIPITLSRIINVSLQLANAILIPQRLMVAGYSNSEAVATFGRVTGMTMPLIFLPFIVTSALVINIIPNLSEQVQLKQFHLIRNNIALSLRITLLVALPLTAMYLFFSDPLAMFFYGDKMVGRFIGIMGYSTVFLSLHHTLSGILHGLGKQVITTINYLVGMIFQVFCTYVLVANPSIGINGFFIGFIGSTLIICVLDYIALNRVIQIRISFSNYIIKPFFSTIFMTVVVFVSYAYMQHLALQSYLIFLSCLALGGSSYIVSLFITQGLPSSLLKRLMGRVK